MTYRFNADRGVYHDASAPQPSNKLTVRSPLYRSGVTAGMDDARRDRLARGAFEAHRRIVNAVYGVGHDTKAYSDGYLAGFTAIANGFIA